MLLGHRFFPKFSVSRPFNLFRNTLGVLRVFEASVRVLRLYVAVHELDKGAAAYVALAQELMQREKAGGKR